MKWYHVTRSALCQRQLSFLSINVCFQPKNRFEVIDLVLNHPTKMTTLWEHFADSYWFLPRDAMRNTVFGVALCLSVRMSVCHVGGLYPDVW